MVTLNGIEEKKTWNLLSLLKRTTDQAWCVLDDFNEIVSHDENIDDRQRP